MSQVLINFGVVLLFTVIGGFFAASEMALVSLREGQISRLALEKPKRGARLARLTADPNRYLAAVQVGVTLTGFLSAGFGASRIAPELSPHLENLGLSEGLSNTIAFVVVTVVIVYFSLVLGELAPKRLALQSSESVALAVAGTVNLVAQISRPFIWLLSVSTDLVVKLLGGDPSIGRERITEDELRGLVAAHTDLTEQERELIDDVFAAGDRELREIMIPRTDVAFMKESMSIGAAAREASNSPHSRYPLIRRDPDDVRGFVHVRDLLDPKLQGSAGKIGALRRPLARFPGTKRVIPALAEMRDAGFHLAIVVDEYGGTDGIVTMEDLVEELVGDIRDEYDSVTTDHPPGLSGEREIAGRINLDDFCEETGLVLPDGPYETLAGFVIDRLGHLPLPGDRVEAESCVFTVLSVEGRRVDRILVEPVREEPQEEPQEELETQ